MNQTQTKKSMTKTRLILTTLGLMVLVLVLILYSFPYLINYFVSPEVLIQNTTKALESLSGADIEIGQAKLSMLEGVTFRHVRVRVPEAKRKLEPSFSDDDGLLLKADSVVVKLRRKGILGLDFGLGAIVVRKPEFHLVRMEPENKWNWQMLFAGPAKGPAKKRTFGIGPPITLEEGKIVLTEIRGWKRLSLGDVYFTANAQPQQLKAFYRIDLQTWTVHGPGPNILIDFNTRTSEILSGSMETIAVSNIEQMLPEPLKGWWKKFHLIGKIAVSEIRYKPDSSRRIVLTLENVNTRVPVSKLELDSDSEKSLFNLSELNGRVILDGEELEISEMTGKLNGATCRISGKMSKCLTQPETSPFELKVACDGFVCPEYTDAGVAAYMEKMIPWNIRSFFHDFKPTGKLGFDLAVSRPTDQPEDVHISGKIVGQGCSAEYYKFPYRVKDINGTVDIVDGRFQLNDLQCKTDSGSAVVSGSISDPTSNAEVVLKIDSKRTALDAQLRSALNEQYQAIFEKFKPAGFADTHIELYCPYGGDQTWKTLIDAKIFEVSAVYEGFRYPVSDVKGRLKFTNDKLDMENISGRHGGASFTLSGVVEHFQNMNPSVRLNLSAEKVSIDRMLIDSLPAETGQFIRDCRLTGKTSIQGSLTKSAGSPFDYLLHCRLENAGFQPRDFPYALKNLKGDLTLKPKTIVMEKLVSQSGEETIKVSGQVLSGEQQGELSLEVDAEQLPLTDSLRDAIPLSARQFWTKLKPAGKINGRAEIHHRLGEPWKWLIDLKVLDGEIRYENTSPITGIFGQIIFAPGKIDFKNMVGITDEKASIRFSGNVTNDEKRIFADFQKLEIDRIGVNDGLLSTLVGEKMVKSFGWTAGGTANCRLKDLQIEYESDKSNRWGFTGDLNFQDVRMGVFDKKPVTVRYSGPFEWQGPEIRFGLDGKMELSSLNWHDYGITAVQATLKKELNDQTLNIGNLRGQCNGGQITGIAKLKFAETETRYGLQLTLDNIDAARMMNLKRGGSEIRGKMKGEIYLVGNFGEKYSQLGGGTLQITGAEVLKVPLMEKIYEEVSREPPNLASFHDIVIQFALEKYLVKIVDVELTGPNISLIGSGDVNISNKRINLDLVVGVPKSLNNLPILPEIMEGASREISQIEVHGTTDSPQIKVQSMKDISDTLKTFFSGKTVR
jgi:hypothetical protein